ncbi:MAG: N-formylglutamate amidohydrolase [Janthinobacterium lividum]
MPTEPLLAAHEPAPVEVVRPDGGSALVLTADHAGRRIPEALGRLGVPEGELTRHIAWDIGIAGVAARLSEVLDAALVTQRYSRLVIDCNRDPGVPSSMPEVSEATPVPGNEGLGEDERRRRVEALFTPYHDAIAGLLDRREEAGRRSVLVALHSFTPVYLGERRPMHAAVLYNRDARLSLALRDLLAAEGGLVVAENEPYRVSDLTDYTVPVHAERRGLLHVEIEIRQDLIGDAAGEAEWAERLARLLPAAVAVCDRAGG